MGVWMHQVEMKLDPVAACERLGRMEAWCGEWQLGMRVIETAERGRVRCAFDDARHARAPQTHFGGVFVPSDEVERPMDADAADEDGLLPARSTMLCHGLFRRGINDVRARSLIGRLCGYEPASSKIMA